LQTALVPSAALRTQACLMTLAVAVLGAVVLSALMVAERAGLTATLGAAAIYGAVAIAVLRGLATHAPHRRFGAANAITLVRAGCAAVLAGVALEALLGGEASRLAAGDSWAWALAFGALLALLLDAVDGWLARRSGLASPFGARLDMEVDALFILAVSVLTVSTGRAGAWVLLAGLSRYLFVAAGFAFPSLAAPLAPSLRRKAVCALVGAVLVTALFPPIPADLTGILLGIGMVALIWSFGVDTVWLLSNREGHRTIASPGHGDRKQLPGAAVLPETVLPKAVLKKAGDLEDQIGPT